MKKEKITRISIFDFDGTLVDSPLPDVGRATYQEKTGKPWPHQGWWGRPESLDMEIFDMPLINMVISDYNKERAKPDTLVVMMTGRMVKLGGLVKKILDANGLVFDEYIYNRGGSTDTAKMQSMEQLLKQYPDVREIHMWDDRQEHIPIFKRFGDNLVSTGRLDNFDITEVPSARH